MTERTLQGRHILIVEDEYMLADELRGELEAAEAVVIGPVAELDAAMAAIRSAPRLDGAVLDVNLGGEYAFPIADMLVLRNVPFLFTTGYDASVIPARFGQAPRCEKPIELAKVTAAIGRVVRP